MKRCLIIIPGLGDRDWLYYFLKPVWKLYGFDAHIFVFGWETDMSFAAAFDRLLDYIDTQPGEVYVIGASAGGTTAVNALAARPAVVSRVVTVCTPYAPIPNLVNTLLRQSIAHVQKSLPTLGEAKRKVLSVHASFDSVVPVALSRPKDIAVLRLRSRGHAVTIMLALTVMSGGLRRFLLR